jgi:Ca2+-binding RTX toxin-like protein
MATDIEYALMAGRVYQSTRGQINWLPDLQSQGWVEFFHQQEPSGFEAVSFQRGTDIVISYAGTGSGVDWWANAGGFFGVTSDQLRQAADYYLQIKAANPGATISFTGHSLGGGLASLMAVFFDETAVTFDQAPFRSSAITSSVAASLKGYLLNQLNYSEADLQDLTNFISASTPFGIPHESNVRDISVSGEILSPLSFARIGIESSLLHGTTNLLLANDLHSQALLTVFVQNDQFRQVTFKLPDMMRMIFDNNLYAFSTDTENTENENFLERLVRHQNGIAGNPTTGELAVNADAMLTRFTSNLNVIAQDGGLSLTNSNIAQTLTTFAIQMYYEGVNATDATKQLFAAVAGGGGIQFDRLDVAATLNQAKGYNLYFQKYLNSSAFSDNASYLIRSVLPTLRDWYVQAGSAGMNAADTQNRGAFLLGGNGSDHLTGGTEADLLVGNAGTDTLAGGAGYDTYIYNTGDGQDVISDNDGQGRILYGNYSVNGGIHRETDAPNTYIGAGSFTYVWNGPGTDLTINNLITVQNFQDGQLGITLDDLSTLPDGTPPVIDYNNGLPNDTYFGTADSDYPGPLGGGTPNVNETVYTYGGDDFPFFYSSSQGNHVVFLGTGNDYVEGALGHDRLYGEDGRDILLGGGGGDDLLEGGAGEDFVRGGSGNDVLRGGADADTVVGDSGDDVVLGEDGDDVVSGESQSTPVELMGNDYVDGGNGADWVHGLLGDDHLVGGTGDDHLYGDQVSDIYPEYRYDWPGSITLVQSVPFASTTGGADLLDGGDGNDFLQGDAGDDVLLGGADNDQLYGDDQNQYAVQAGDDWLDGEDGDDTVIGGGGNDTLAGGAGIDKLYGDVGDDSLDGGTENDELYGGDGADVVFGGSGDDLLFGDVLNNPSTVSSAGGNDVLDGGEGNDHLEGGTGDDGIFGGIGNDVLFGQDGADALAGDNGSDELQGGDGNDLLTGDAGDDLLFGEAGADTIYGDDGNDQLTGGTGDDILEGGAGNDMYAFNLGDGDDVITDTALPGEANTIVFGAGGGQKRGTGYLFEVLRGRPRGRSVEARPAVSAN